MKKIKELICKIKEYIKGNEIICIDFDDEGNEDVIPVKIPTSKSKYMDYKRFLKNDYIRNHLYD